MKGRKKIDGVFPNRMKINGITSQWDKTEKLPGKGNHDTYWKIYPRKRKKILTIK